MNRRAVVIREGRTEHAKRLYEDLRWEEKEELRLAGQDPYGACVRSLAIGESFLVEEGPSGDLICAFGVAPMTLLSGIGAVWMLSTRRLAQHQRSLFPVARAHLDRFQGRFGLLINAVWEQNRAALSLTRRLGFRHESPVQIGPESATFIPISRRSSYV